MKNKTINFILVLSLIAGISLFSASQAQETRKTDQQSTATTTTITPTLDNLRPLASYDPGGRRDPFKDLIGKGRVSGPASAEGGQLTIENATLVGIVKTQKSYVAIISGPQQMPYFLKVGDKLADGYIFDINSSQVIFRKTHDRGFPLMRPINVVKEINPEER
ncbi:MAG TPA: hypothetical protein P5258_05665 [Candidatus Saccharicenans sp.]|jgi:Tfp pilus assembly protein PilP|nr:hypothetical protein [Candidatus Saccharicenans sp.]HRT26017.1 hypothetical protein [Candidatus Saccharicenans sp.]